MLDLEIGETLKTLEGTTVVESLERRPEPEAVYNIEVEGDHVYRVGESEVLVHNNSADIDVAACMRVLAQRRAARGLSAVGSEPEGERKATFAVLYIDGQTFYGVNSFYQDPNTTITLERVNAQTKTHVEAEAVQKAVNAGATGCVAVMCVDRPPCEACGPPRNGLRSLARNLGVQTLIVHSPRGREEFTPTT